MNDRCEINAAAFLFTLGRRTHAISTHPDPLRVAWRFIEENGKAGEGRALREVIRTLELAGNALT